MSSGVFFAAMVPATLAVSRTFPFSMRFSAIRRMNSGAILTDAEALAVRSVEYFSEIFIISVS